MNKDSLATTANAMVANGKGLLAIDESVGTMGKRLATIGVRNTERNRNSYRDMLLTSEGLGNFISGAILFEETLAAKPLSGARKLADQLKQAGILAGIKVDTGAKALAGCPGELVTEGLDGLRERLSKYARLGARFAKWRAVINIDDEALPTGSCISANAHALARYAALCQEAGLVPIVEPEVMMDSKRTIERCEAATGTTLRAVFAALHDQGVFLEGVVLKANMVVSSTNGRRRAGADEVAERTVRCLKASVPAAVPGVVFLSGGQSAVEATTNLNAMNLTADHPWTLSFSFGRALQEPALAAWGGQVKNRGDVQAAMLRRARMNSAACFGRYSEEMEAIG